jgi:hypothetical protein
MFERESTVYSFLLGYGRRLVADIDDARFVDQPAPGVNHPAWLLGHLTIASDFGLRLLGRPRACPKAWHRDFGPGSEPKPDRSAYPSKEELTAALEAGHERVAEAVRTASAEDMALPHEIEFLRNGLPTKADLLSHLMTAHEAMHLGHLSNWRRQMGMPYLF